MQSIQFIPMGGTGNVEKIAIIINKAIQDIVGVHEDGIFCYFYTTNNDIAAFFRLIPRTMEASWKNLRVYRIKGSKSAFMPKLQRVFKC